MVSQIVEVKNASGLHARPANVFVKEALSHKGCKITFKKEGEDRVFQARSMVSVIQAVVKCGTRIEIFAEGEDEEAALQAMVEAVASGLGE